MIRDIINEMVNDIIINTQKNIKENKIRHIKDIYNSENLLVNFSENMSHFDTKIKFFLREKMYFSKNVMKKTNMGKKIINFSFLYFTSSENFR